MSKRTEDGSFRSSVFFKHFKATYYNLEFHKPLKYIIIFVAFLMLMSVPGFLANNAAVLKQLVKQGSLAWQPQSGITFVEFFVSISVFYLSVTFLALIVLSRWYIKTIYTSLSATRTSISLVLLATIFTYLVVVHIFACIYLALVDLDSTSIVYDGRNLQAEGLDAVSAYYFSLTTIATVGFGDIHPSSSGSLAKIIVMLEILIGLAYAVFVFSVLAAFIRESRRE